MDYKENQSTILIEGKYNDILGNEYLIDDEIDVTAWVNQLKESNLLLDSEFLTNPTSQLQKINENLRRISDRIK